MQIAAPSSASKAHVATDRAQEYPDFKLLISQVGNATVEQFEKLRAEHPTYKVTHGGAFGYTALHQAAHTNNLELANHIMDENPQTVNLGTKNGYTPLHAAASAGSLGVLAELIKRKADIHHVLKRDDYTVSPIQMALAYEKPTQLATVEMLLQHGAKHSLKTPVALFHGPKVLQNAFKNLSMPILEKQQENFTAHDRHQLKSHLRRGADPSEWDLNESQLQIVSELCKEIAREPQEKLHKKMLHELTSKTPKPPSIEFSEEQLKILDATQSHVSSNAGTSKPNDTGVVYLKI